MHMKPSLLTVNTNTARMSISDTWKFLHCSFENWKTYGTHSIISIKLQQNQLE